MAGLRSSKVMRTGSPGLRASRPEMVFVVEDWLTRENIDLRMFCKAHRFAHFCRRSHRTGHIAILLGTVSGPSSGLSFSTENMMKKIKNFEQEKS